MIPQFPGLRRRHRRRGRLLAECAAGGAPSGRGGLRAGLPGQRRRPVRRRRRGRMRLRRRTWWCSPSGTGPGFSGTAHPARAVTRRTSACRAPVGAGRGDPGDRPADRARGRSPVAPTRSGHTRGGRPRSSRPSSRARRAARRSPACSRAGSIPRASCRLRSPAMRAASPTPTWHRRSAGQRRRQQPRPDPGVPVRTRPVLHLVRL